MVQYSEDPDSLKSPALSETTLVRNKRIRIEFADGAERYVDCIGIGNTDGKVFEVNGTRITFDGNGLYMLDEPVCASCLIEIKTDATFVGRIAAGRAANIPTAVAKQPGFGSTNRPRMTLSGQVVSGAGGYNYRTVSLDSRYKIGREIMEEIAAGYKYIGMGYPFFIDLTDESYKLPFARFYGIDANQQDMGFESGVRGFLYSRRFEFRECF